MKPFRDWSIHRKLTALFVAMACITAAAIAFPMSAFDMWGLHRAMMRDLSTLADVMARNSTAAISFHDADAAKDVLQALRAEPSISAACIYTESGAPLAIYVRDGNVAQFVPPIPEPEGAHFKGDRIRTFRRIIFAGESIGTIYLESDLERLHTKFRQYEIILALVFSVSVSLALLLSSRLQRPISAPLGTLVHTAEAVASANDYSLRAVLNNKDEFGILVSAFNGMLEQIESRENQLHAYRVGLEKEVASRTAELLAANRQMKLQAAALEAAANSIVITDLKGTIVWTNPAFSSLSGYSKEEANGQNPRILTSGEQNKAFYARLWQTILAGQTWTGEIVNRRKDGLFRTEEISITPVSLEAGQISHFVAIKQDITERKKAEEALRSAEEKYRAIFEDAVVGIFQITADGRPVSINRALAQMHGYDSPQHFLSEVHDFSQLFAKPTQWDQVTAALEKNDVLRGIEIEVYRRDGSKKWVLCNLRTVREADGNVNFWEGTVEDITDRKLAEERVEFLAYYDSLTGLPNRSLLQDRLAKALASARRRHEKVGVMFVDLDRFKIINDSLGHSVGDRLLQQVAQRFTHWAREQDTVARVGGDEFLIALTSVKDASDAAIAAERILRAISEEFVIHAHSFTINCSIGISMYPDHGSDAETLIKNADAAMYCAKEAGRNTFRFFTETMNSQVVERLTLESSLRIALDRNELSLVYQPQTEIATGRILGFEALLRWRHPEMGFVAPDKFIRVAENTGLILPIGEWVLRTACTQAKRWHEQGFPPFPVAVNVSAIQFRQEGFRELIGNVLHETGLRPHYLELELTESLLLSNRDVMFQVLEELKAMGLRLAIDDFGTGYSSLSYLRQFPVNKLKIDRSFVHDVARNPDDAAITVAIINMAKSLGLRVIAEGVEDEAQMAFLREHGCDEIQGYLFSKPLAVEEVPEILRRGAVPVCRATDVEEMVITESYRC